MQGRDLVTLQYRVFTKFNRVINRFQLHFQLQDNKLTFFQIFRRTIDIFRERNLFAPLIIRILLLEFALTKIGATPLLVQGTFST
jgi:hypothetical protein